MAFRNVVNDGTNRPPRLRTQYNMWATHCLPRGGKEWTVPQRLDRIAAAGFGGFEAQANSIEEARELKKMLNDRSLEIGFAAFGGTPEDLDKPIEFALEMGAGYITAQVFGAMKHSAEIIEILQGMYERVNGAGLPFFVETHRGRVTQDLLRTLRVIDGLDRVRFTGDFSHYVVAGELGGEWSEEIWQAFEKIAARCGNYHGRIGYGEQVQNDIGDGLNKQAQQFKKLWTLGMKHWLKQAQPGDVLPFCSELGPPGYSITDLDGREISDRWEQSLVIKRLAEEAFADAQKSI
jgi:sugar phosphate isomerase/epimerase